ncbi:DUF4386 domain-containing protein [Modestobacter altitudinis]|uniref:DUF4386 domain-containing protein n=1 Tax=Modestobacter altitudinis TaxID=2213158 RepID=UPI00110D02F3|nr:DUF4386 domain-containing protein [Modestobacter altitudinis]
MTTTAPTTTAASRPAPDPMRRRARIAGVLYLLTFVSIPALGLYKPVKDDVGAFLLGAGSDTGVMVGALSEVVIGVAGISTAVVLFPVLKRQNHSAALGIVTARLVETSLIFVGVVSMLTVVTLRTDVVGTTGTDPASLLTTGHTLVAVYTWTFLLSQSLMPVFVDLLLGYVLYRSGLVPRTLPLIAFVGAPLLLVSDIAIFFGVYENVSPLALVAAIPVAVFEVSFGIYLIAKGFKPGAVAALQAGQAVR